MQVYNKWELVSVNHLLFLRFFVSYIFIVSFNPPNNVNQMLSLFYRGGNWDMEKLNYLPKMVVEIQIPCVYISKQSLAWPCACFGQWDISKRDISRGLITSACPLGACLLGSASSWNPETTQTDHVEENGGAQRRIRTKTPDTWPQLVTDHHNK